MAEHLARIFGTEEDRVNCPFYYKTGACRNGDQCTRQHNRPTSSQTLLLAHMYHNTPESLQIAQEEPWDDEMYDRSQEHLELFYEEVFLELANYGEIEDMICVDNVSDHMLGNVYVKYYNDEDSERALQKLTGRYYGGRLIQAEFSPVTDFREARCRAFHESRCHRGGYCNFMHIKHIPKAVKRRLVREMYEEHAEYLGNNERDKKRKRRRRSGERGGRDEDRAGGGGGGGGGGDAAPEPFKRQSSEERRAMIASWNQEGTS
eukprot:GEMP01018108.1.p1 GENE.GEMP01018108.1~~GEMP01018108.1.p1  ORF type:complete len:262 (+),score=54.01 GEMP01018108.1:1305-2090(+)